MTGISDLDVMDEKAFEGNPDLVNLLISDIYQNLDNIDMPGDTTASNFGKYQDWRHIGIQKQPEIPDLLAALYKMVAETIAVIANLACKQCATNDILVSVTGGGTLNRALMEHLKSTFEYLQQPCIIPRKAVFGTLHGLFVYEGLI
jgi:pantothenate kinase